MIGGDIQPRLADFGLSTLLDEQITESLQNNIGSFRWTARERFLDRPQSTFESDVWSFGMTAMELFTSEVPFSHLKERQICLHIHYGNLPSRPSSGPPRGGAGGGAPSRGCPRASASPTALGSGRPADADADRGGTRPRAEGS